MWGTVCVLPFSREAWLIPWSSRLRRALALCCWPIWTVCWFSASSPDYRRSAHLCCLYLNQTSGITAVAKFCRWSTEITSDNFYMNHNMRYASNPTANAALDSDIAARTHTSRRKQYRWITQIIFPYFFLFCDNADPSQSVIGDFTACLNTVPLLLSCPSYPGTQAWCDPRTHATRAKEDQCLDPLRLRRSLLFSLCLFLALPPFLLST